MLSLETDAELAARLPPRVIRVGDLVRIDDPKYQNHGEVARVTSARAFVEFIQYIVRTLGDGTPFSSYEYCLKETQLAPTQSLDEYADSLGTPRRIVWGDVDPPRRRTR